MLSVDGKGSPARSIPHSIAFLMAIDESFDIGVDSRTGVDDSYKLPFQFTGKIDKLTFNLGPTQMTSSEQKSMRHAASKRGTSPIPVNLRASRDITDAKGRLLAHATTTCLVFEIAKGT